MGHKGWFRKLGTMSFLIKPLISSGIVNIGNGDVGGLRDDEDVAEVEWSRLDEDVGGLPDVEDGLTNVDLSGLDEDVGGLGDVEPGST